MPAAMLVGNLAVLIRLDSNQNLDLGTAIKDLVGSPLGTLIALLFALILGSVLIQAFEFEAIRILEGYSLQHSGPLFALIERRIRHHARNRSDLEDEYREAQQGAYSKARTIMLAIPGNAYPQGLLDVIETDVYGRSQPDDIDPELLRRGRLTNWMRHLPPESLYRLDALDSRLGRYPAPHRILPTRLGNALRSAEDQLHLEPGENLEGYVLRHHAQLPELLKNEHHDYRTRLEMYTSLFFVFLILTLAAPTLLANFAHWWLWVPVSCSYTGLACLSYEAAIASAGGYGDVLIEVDRQVQTRLDA
jgi:hypothetical protein